MRDERGRLVLTWGRAVAVATVASAVIAGLAFASGWIASVRADAAFHERVEEGLADEKKLSGQVTRNELDIATLQRAVTDLVASQTETNALLRQFLHQTSRFQEEQRR